jgi:murein DD-endopeptidase MepM/ murein hydrolase activator NlpD
MAIQPPIQAPVAMPQSVPTRADVERDFDGAARQFEAMFVRQILAEVRPTAGLVGGSAEPYRDFVDEALADAITAGGGLGLARQIAARLSGKPEAPDRLSGMTAAYQPVVPRSASLRLAVMPPTERPVAPRESPPDVATLVSVEAATAPPRQTSGFGYRKDPFDGSLKRHSGVDLGAAMGTPIHATEAGVVKFAGVSGGYGNLVVIDHGDGVETRYAHCSVLEVKPGDHVVAGQVVARVGSTGRSTGPHLHLELREGGVAVDPSLWILQHADPLREFAQQIAPTIREQDQQDESDPARSDP